MEIQHSLSRAWMDQSPCSCMRAKETSWRDVVRARNRVWGCVSQHPAHTCAGTTTALIADKPLTLTHVPVGK